MNNDGQKRPENKLNTEDRELMVEALAAALLKAKDGEHSADPHARPISDGEHTIDLLELFYYILSKIQYVVIAALVGTIVMGIYAFSSIRPEYQATAKLYIMNQDDVNINVSDLQIGSMLTMDYREVFRTWEVHEMVRSALNLEYNYTEMQNMVKVSNPDSTRILYITVTNEDAQLATDIANAYAEAGKEFILQTMDTKEPNVFSVALVPSKAISASKTNHILLGFIGGTVLAIGILFLTFVMDDRPRTPEDIMKAAGIPTLAIVPVEAKAIRELPEKGARSSKKKGTGQRR